MKPSLISLLSANTRIVLVEARSLAMAGRVKEAIEKLDLARAQLSGTSSDLSASDIEIELVVLSLLKSEIFHLDFNDGEAFETLRSEILTKVSKLPREAELVISQNRFQIELALSIVEAANQHSRSSDERRIAGISFWDPESVVYAFEYAAEGKNFESLPVFWGELNRTYKSGSWPAYRQASRRLSGELLSLGYVRAALYHALISQSEKLIEACGRLLLAGRDNNQVKSAIEMLLMYANLKHHASLAASFFNQITDAIPDELLDPVFEWLIGYSSASVTNWNDLALSRSVWDALFELTRRLSVEQRKRVLEAAINHPQWEGPTRLREKLLGAVNATVSTLPTDRMEEVARKVLPAATTQKNDIDYHEALNLLSHIAELSSDAKKVIGDELYKGDTFESYELRRLGPLYNREMLPNDAEEEAFRLAEDIRKQVVKTADAVEPSRPISTFGAIQGEFSGEKYIVYPYGFSPLDGLLVYRKSLSGSATEAIVSALIDMICEPENIPANKIGLIKRIIDLSDRLSQELAVRIFEKLAPLAQGKDSKTPEVMKGFGDPQNRLNPFKLNVQTQVEVQAAALYALSKIEEEITGVYGDRLTPLLEMGVTHSDLNLRSYAFSSLAKLGSVNDVLINSLLIGTGSSDTRIAGKAFYALAVNKKIEFTETQWNTLTHSLTLAQSSPDSTVRRNAAYLIAKRESEWSKTEFASSFEQLKRTFSNDLCWSVRTTALQNLGD